MRRFLSIALGALAFVILSAGAAALAQITEPTTSTSVPTTKAPTTTSPSVPPTSAPTPTTVKAGTTTSTTKAGTAAPKPPPASGASQPLDPSLLGGTPIPTLGPATTQVTVEPFVIHTTTTIAPDTSATALVSTKKNTPAGATMILATVAWLASVGGLLVYAEDKRGRNWRHLAR